MNDRALSLLAMRRELYERLGPAQVALSVNGRDVHFVAPVDAGLAVGSFAVAPAEEGDPVPSLLLQIRDVKLVEREGPALGGLEIQAGGQSATASVRPILHSVAGTAVVLGTLTGTDFVRTQRVEPFGERLIRPAVPEESAAVAARLAGESGVIEIGQLSPGSGIPMRLQARGFARHTFMCGQSGSGKTYTTGALFERLLTSTTLPIIVLDPNSDHVHLDTLREPASTSPEALRYAAVAPTVRVVRARGLECSHTLCADFSDLAPPFQALLLQLHPVRDADEFAALRRITNAMTPPYSVQDVLEAAGRVAVDDRTAAGIGRRIANLGLVDWSVWRRGEEASISHAGLRDERCVVFDLGSLANPEERTAVALAVLGNLWASRQRRTPVLIAVDEAHNVFPAVTDDPLLAATTELGILIAGEGRKFGLHLFVATQRPSKVHPSVVSQCDNLMLMRMNGERDIEDLVSLFSHVPAAMLREAVGFGLGEALFAGPIAPVPVHGRVGARLTLEGGSDVPTT